ncbi:flagellar protein FliT [Microbulbifer elongatus]|uniref:Flagellar protein FliT n=1 Tax=Microbulbifer elongatus TaxID=86173 RepID=A0ABT1P035_9GAMM|nr:flagellar protein FliT [Microbulbifer elongatus]MCQ3828344.1 flagellar protein FliT [Microbulbifer elongatus]
MKNKLSVGEVALSSPAAILAGYAALLARSSRMLAYVHARDWFNLVEEQTSYAIEVETLANAESEFELNDHERKRKMELLEQILEQDLEIRQRLEQRQNELHELIGTNTRKRDLSRAYGTLIPFNSSPQ